MYNLNRLFGSDDSVVSNKKTRQELNVKDGLLFLVREQVEEDISELMTSRVRDNVEVELNNKMNLITTQLTFNLTMKAGNSVNDHEKARNQNSRYEEFNFNLIYNYKKPSIDVPGPISVLVKYT